MHDAGVNFITVETAFGRRPFLYTQKDDLNDVQLRTDHELWLKEASINVATQYALQRYPDTKYIAWIDADIRFQDPHWAEEVIEWHQHYKVLQLFSQAIDMGPQNQILKTHNGFVYSWFQNDFKLPPKHKNDFGDYYSFFVDPTATFHPGYAWSMRTETFNELGGLIDFAALGSGDRHMALAFVEEVDRSYHPDLSQRYKRKCHIWEERCKKYLQKDIGFLKQIILHGWHGNKADRKYPERWQILVRNGFDPDLDLKRDAQGLYQLTERNWRLRVEFEAYFKVRNEDSIDLLQKA